MTSSMIGSGKINDETHLFKGFLDFRSMITLQFDLSIFYGPTARTFLLELGYQGIDIQIVWVESINDRHHFTISSLIDINVDFLLFSCDIFTDTEFLGKTTLRTYFTHLLFLLPPE